MEINLELLQQLPAEEAEDGLCTLTCSYSCLGTSPYLRCEVTGFIL